MDILQDIANLEEQSCAQNTTDSYEFAWKIWGDFVEWAGIHSTTLGVSRNNPTVEHVQAFVVWMQKYARGGKGYAPATVRARIAGLASKLREIHPDQPLVTDHPSVKRVLKGVKRSAAKSGVQQRKMKAILPDTLERMLAAGRVRYGTDSILTIRNESLLTLGWNLGARCSELVSLTRNNTTPILEDGLRIGYRFHWLSSKADKDCEGMSKSIGTANLFDPVARLEAWLEASQTPPSVSDALWPLYRAVGTHNSIHSKSLSEKSILVLVRRYLSLAGIDPAGYGSHSLRAGVVTYLASQGYTALDIKKVTGHKSIDTVAGYVRDTGHDAIDIMRTGT
jgi:integrase